MFPFLVTVTTTGQHKRSTTKMLQIEFIFFVIYVQAAFAFVLGKSKHKYPAHLVC